MAYVVAISGSPAAESRSRFLMQSIATHLKSADISVDEVLLDAIPAQHLFSISGPSEQVADAIVAVARADAILVATPVYKAAYSGLLKSFLDLLPQTAFADKVVLPIATAGSSAHLLALEYALKPVLSALGARFVLGGTYAVDTDLPRIDGRYSVGARLRERIDDSVNELIRAIDLHASAPSQRTRPPIAFASSS